MGQCLPLSLKEKELQRVQSERLHPVEVHQCAIIHWGGKMQAGLHLIILLLKGLPQLKMVRGTECRDGRHRAEIMYKAAGWWRLRTDLLV